jgi:hypothetical protein
VNFWQFSIFHSRGKTVTLLLKGCWGNYLPFIFFRRQRLVPDMASLYAIPYNGTEPTGGDSLTENLNQYYEVKLYLKFYKTLIEA